MLGWSIRARACRSASNRAITCRVSMPGLMTLSATLRWTGLGLLGHVDDAHAALADLLQQLVRADDRAGPLAARWHVHGAPETGTAAHRVALGPLVTAQQFIDPQQKLGIPHAGRFDVRDPALRGRLVQGSEEDRLGIVSILGHGATSFAFRVHLQCGIGRQITARNRGEF